MTTNSSSWNDSLMNGWADAQRKYWETWRDFAGNNGTNPFAAAFTQGAGGNPFAGLNPGFMNMLNQNPFASNLFGGSSFGTNPFANNPFMQNPFNGAAAGSENPFSGMLEQWWSTLKPVGENADVMSVAQRFFDMGKSYMSMSEGMFGAAGQEQPEAAMQLWMSSMQAALQQWITQIQNNADLVTPDLPGVSGTTLSTWAEFADSVAPWLNVSQNYLKDIAEGHLPGGIEMPGLGAAQEQFCRALSMPGLGYNREQQESMQDLARHLLSYHDALRAYKLAFAKTALSSLDAVQERLGKMHEAGEHIESLRALYDMWVDASEDAYGEFAMSDEYQMVYGDLVNALMRVRQDMNEMAEHHYRLMNIPTRSEMDTVQKRQQENRREGRALRREIAALRAELDKLSGARPARASTAKRKPSAPAQDSLPIEEAAEEDLTEIKGVGPKMAEKLYAQGITSFAQIAKMSAKAAEELDETLKAQGRIMRDDWIGQAKKLRG